MKKIIIAIAAAALAGCASLKVTPSPETICVKEGDRIGFLGDSITEYGNLPLGYINLVVKGLELSGVHAEKIPAGRGWNKSTQMLARLDSDILSKGVQWMTLSCGVNDAWHHNKDLTDEQELETYKKEMAEIMDKCKAANVNVIVLTATMIYEDADGYFNKRLAPFNDWLRKEAARRKLMLVDLNAQMQAELERLRANGATGDKLLTKDGVHMAFPGDCMMAWGILEGMGVPASSKKPLMNNWKKMKSDLEAQRK